MAFGTTPLSTTTIGANQFPLSGVYVQGTAGGNITALQGGPVSSADANSNVSAPAAIYVPDGNDVTLGTTTDASSANTLIGLTKAIKANTASVTIGSLPAISGTVTANIGTTNGLALDTSVNGLLLAQGSTTSGEKGPMMQGAVTTGAPTYTTAQTSPLSLTTAGALRIDGSGATQPVSGTITANAGTGTFTVSGTVTANAGTGSFNNASVGATAAAVPADATYLGGNKAGNLVGLSLDGSGNLNVNVAAGGASGGTSSSFGSAFPGTGTAAGFSDGTNMQGARAFDADTGVGTQYVLGANLRISASGGSIEAKGSQTSANSIPVVIASDQGAVAVSGTITANAGTGTFNNQQSNITADYDTGAGTQTMTMFGLALPASGGAVAGGTASNPVRIDPTGTTTQPVSGTVTANQGGAWTVTANAGTNLNTSALALDTSVNGLLLAQASTTSGEKGPLVQGAVTTNAPTYTTAQTNPLSLDTSGLLRVSIKDTPANTNNLNVALAASSATVTVSGTVTANAGTGNFNNASVGATGSAVPADATYQGGIAETSLPTAASAGNLTGALFDKFGRAVVLPNAMRDLVLPIPQLTLTATTTETTLIAQVASTFLDIVSIVAINTSATATQVDFRDSTAGTIRLSLYLPAGDTRGIALPVPLPQSAVNQNWTAKCGTSVSSVIITGTYITNK